MIDSVQIIMISYKVRHHTNDHFLKDIIRREIIMISTTSHAMTTSFSHSLTNHAVRYCATSDRDPWQVIPAAVRGALRSFGPHIVIISCPTQDTYDIDSFHVPCSLRLF